MKPSYLVHPSMKANLAKPADKPQDKPVEQPQQGNVSKPKEKEFEGIRKFPRPLISQEDSKLKQIHSSKVNFEEPVNMFYNYTAKDEGNATCRHARASVYCVPDNMSQLTKSKIALSVVSLVGIYSVS